MTRAKYAALKAYPKRKDGRARGCSCTDEDVRKVYAHGYKRAEKDTLERAIEWLRPRLRKMTSPGLTEGILEEFRNGMK